MMMYVLSAIFPPMFFSGMLRLPTARNCLVAHRYNWRDKCPVESGSVYGTWPTCTLNEAEMYTPPETAKIWFVCEEQALHKESFILVCVPLFVSITNSHTVSNNYVKLQCVQHCQFDHISGLSNIFLQTHLCRHKYNEGSCD